MAEEKSPNIFIIMVMAVISSVILEIPCYALRLFLAISEDIFKILEIPFLNYAAAFLMFALYMLYQIFTAFFTLKISSKLSSANVKRTIMNVIIFIIFMFILSLKIFHVFNFGIQYMLTLLHINIQVISMEGNYSFAHIIYAFGQLPIYMFFLFGGIINDIFKKQEGEEKMNTSESIRTAAKTTPSKRQIEWQKTEFYAFFHFGVNTYTNREWGTGREDPAIFNPVKFDADQWINAVKSAGMKGVIITAKHHDGFCLWQTETTEHCVRNSPWRNGKGDVVREVAEAAKRGGLKFGVYLSPWDMHEKTYGDSDKYNEFYLRQLTELCTNYGELFTIWFDGACGEGENGKKQVYDWDAYLSLCNKLQPNAVQFNFGDIRWCGNEAGACRAAEWSVLPAFMATNDVILSHSQKKEDTDGSFRKRALSVTESDLGSRELIEGETDFIWYPCETDTSIRPGWFYHPQEDGKVRSLDELMNIYYNSVGGNSTLLLNIPPDTNGLIHENDVRRLEEIGAEIKKAFEHNLCRDTNYFLAANDEDFTSPLSIDVELKNKADISKVVLMENIAEGQRIENFIIEVEADGVYKTIYEGQTVGYKRIAVLKEKACADKIRITITSSRLNPSLSFIGVY